MRARQRALAELRASIPEVTPDQAHQLQQRGAVLVDVREPDEVSQGSPSGARRIVRGFLELNIEESRRLKQQVDKFLQFIDAGQQMWEPGNYFKKLKSEKK